MVDEIQEDKQVMPKSVSDALAVAEKLKAENDRMDKNIKKLEELKAYEALGGKSEGAKKEETPKEIDVREYSKSVLSGKLPDKK